MYGVYAWKRIGKGLDIIRERERYHAATLAKAYSQMYNGKSRHLGVRHSMIRELITNGVISIEFVRSQQNLANYLTKGLARDLVIKYAEGTEARVFTYHPKDVLGTC
ncbi:hypothetical protein Tco_0536169 [Tanacetum coccineum]